MRYKERKCLQKKKDYIFRIYCKISFHMKRVLRSIWGIFVETVRTILLRALKIIMLITNMLFIVSVFMLLLNIEETLAGIKFTNTKYFLPMVSIMGIHFLVIFFYNLIKENSY